MDINIVELNEEINSIIERFARKHTSMDYAGRLLRWIELQKSINEIINHHLTNRLNPTREGRAQRKR